MSISRRRLLTCSAAAGAAILAGSYWTQRWEHIVIHHSAGTRGDIALLQRVHRERQAHDPIKAIPYHYVIGNGHGMPMGAIGRDWRSEFHLWGSHVSARNKDRNFRGLGICMIGNFDITPVPEPQYQALVMLLADLMARYRITTANINGHGLIAGEKTLCPGRYFPMHRLQDDLQRLPGM